MDNLLDEMVRAARRCERAAALFKKDPIDGMIRRLSNACQEVGRAWSGSFIGYQSTVYIDGLRPAQPGEFFSIEWGPMRSNGEWAEYAFDGVRGEIERRAGEQDMQPINDAVSVARSAFDSGREEILPALDAILVSRNDHTLKDLRNSIAELRDHFSMEEFAQSWLPRGQQIVRERRCVV